MSLRTDFENVPTATFDADNKRVLFAEDVNAMIEAIEGTLFNKILMASDDLKWVVPINTNVAPNGAISGNIATSNYKGQVKVFIRASAAPMTAQLSFQIIVNLIPVLTVSAVPVSSENNYQLGTIDVEIGDVIDWNVSNDVSSPNDGTVVDASLGFDPVNEDYMA